MMPNLRILLLLVSRGTLQGCVWWSHTGGRNESIGTDSTSGHVVVAREGMTAEQAMEKAHKVITGWAPLDLDATTPTKLVTEYKAVQNTQVVWVLPTPFFVAAGTYPSAPTARFRVTAELVSSNPATIDIRVSGQPVQIINQPELTATPEQVTAMEFGIRDPMIRDLKKTVEGAFGNIGSRSLF